MSQTSTGRALGVANSTPTLDGLSVGGNGTATIELGAAATDLVGFYGTTALARRAAATQTTLTLTATQSGSGQWGFASSDKFNAFANQLAEVCATLTLLGLWKGAA